MSSLELQVDNVKCGGCAATIREGLLTLSGIDEVTVVVESGSVTISGTGFDLTKIHAKLDEIGFPVRSEH